MQGYFIQGGTSPSAADVTDLVVDRTATIGGLTNGTTYYFRVNAQNSDGDGPSVTVQVTPQGLGSAPGSPAGLKTSSGDGFIALSWSPPSRRAVPRSLATTSTWDTSRRW